MHHSVLLLLLLLPYTIYCGNILVFPVDGSHWINMKILVMELHSKGHNITVIRGSNSWYIKEESPYYNCLTINVGSFDDDFVEKFVPRMLEIRKNEASIWEQLVMGGEVLIKFAELHEKFCNMTAMIFENKHLMNSLQDTKYDVMLTDPAFGGGVLLAHKLGLPLVFNVRWTILGDGHFAIAPSPLSYIPVPGAELTDRMTFFERVKNVLLYFLSFYQQSKHFGQTYQAFCDKYFGPHVDYFSLFQNADIWLMRNDFTFEFPRPTMPNVIYMSGFQCTPSNPLPADLEDFVQSSGEHGVIIMSLGTLFGKLLSDLTDEIAAAFAQLPQKVIWRHDGPRPATLGNNTLLVDWMPQNDLLGHPKTKLFVAHGGTNGVQEAIYHGVPLLGVPLAFDQPDNLSRMKAKGTAKIVDISNLNRVVFLEALKEVLLNPSYQENMQRLSRLHRDQPMKPMDQAVFWTEYVMRNGGAPHLRSQSYKMSWIVYNSLDVVFTLVAATGTICWLTYLMMRGLCLRVMCRKKTIM